MLTSLVVGLMRAWFSPTPFSPLSVHEFTTPQKSASSRPRITSAPEIAAGDVLK